MSDFFNYNNRKYYFSPPLYTWLTEHAPTSVLLKLLKNVKPGRATENQPVKSIMNAFQWSNTPEGSSYWADQFYASQEWMDIKKKISQDPSKFKEVI